MKSWQKYFVVLLAVCTFHVSKAQEKESAPQEPPFVQEENEFDAIPQGADEADALSIEEEIKDGQPAEQKETVDLNKLLPIQIRNLKKNLNLKMKVHRPLSRSLTMFQQLRL